MSEPMRVALTGGIATGKSHVRAQFESLGVATIDADTLAREAVAPGSTGLAAVVHRFGPQVLDPQGTLNRRALGAIVFSDAEARRDLEAIIHPIVRQRMDAWFAALDAAAHPFALADIPLLYETRREGAFDRVIVVACNPDLQVRRIVARDQLSEMEARQRIAAQLPIADKVRRADHLIVTDGTFEDTKQQVREVYDALRAASSSRAS